MNREIKFRVWDVGCKKFLYPKSNLRFWEGDWEHPKLICSIGNEGNYFSLGEHIIQQYTSLKTKTGQEIYEGDIINTKAARYEVIFRDGMFAARRFMGIGSPTWFTLLADIAEIAFVIGNIFENPELLKDVIKDNFNKNE